MMILLMSHCHHVTQVIFRKRDVLNVTSLFGKVIFTVRNCRKVIFSQVSVSHSVHGGCLVDTP